MSNDLQYDVFLSPDSLRSRGEKDKAVMCPLAERLRACLAEGARRTRKNGTSRLRDSPSKDRQFIALRLDAAHFTCSPAQFLHTT